MPDFSGPLLKIERADQHIDNLELLLRRFVADNTKRFSPQNHKRALKQGRSIKSVNIPRHTPVVLGDAIHNLRSSLDHAYCILIEANGHSTTEYSRFPFGGKDWASIEGSINGHISKGNGPSITVRDFIRDEVQPYPGGKHRLYDLHLLDIADKHQCILPTAADHFSSGATLYSPEGAKVGVVKSIRGSNNGGANLAMGGYIAIPHNNLDNAFQITFGQGQPLEGEPMLDTMRKLRDSTLSILNDLAKLVP